MWYAKIEIIEEKENNYSNPRPTILHPKARSQPPENHSQTTSTQNTHPLISHQFFLLENQEPMLDKPPQLHISKNIHALSFLF